MLRPPGRPVKGSFGEFFAHAKALGFAPKTVIDVGVADGTSGLYTSFPDAHFIMLEPLAEYEPALKRLAAEYDAEYVLAAVGPETGTTRIVVDPRQPSTASIIKVWGTNWSPGGLGGADTSEVRDVPMITLDSLLAAHRIEPPIVLKLDIQGAELLALDGGRELLSRCAIVVLETSLYKFGGSSPELHTVVAYMHQRGFVVYDILGGYYRRLDKALGQVDLVFVQETGRFRQSHKW